jgi:hypothetical protein
MVKENQHSNLKINLQCFCPKLFKFVRIFRNSIYKTSREIKIVERWLKEVPELREQRGRELSALLDTTDMSPSRLPAQRIIARIERAEHAFTWYADDSFLLRHPEFDGDKFESVVISYDMTRHDFRKLVRRLNEKLDLLKSIWRNQI